MWGWMAIGGVLALLYSYYRKAKGTTSNSTAAAQQAAGNAPGGVDASLVPQFINQTYENITPPPAPNVTVNNTVPEDNDFTTGTPHVFPPNHHPPTPSPVPNRQPVPMKVTYTKYTVQPGDTLQSLSQKFHVSVTDIAKAPGNVYVKGEVPGDLKVGQQLGTGAGIKTGQVLNIPHYAAG